MNRCSYQPDRQSEARSTEWAVDRSIAAITPLSRSFQGESNTDVSAQKEPFLLCDGEIAPQVHANFRAAVRGLLTIGPRDIRLPQDTELVLLDTSRVINRDLHPSTRPFFRTWETPFPEHASVRDIPDAYRKFCTQFTEEWAFSFRDPISFAAWMEWSSNARGHFWYDGCGRIARSVSVTALVRTELVYPTFEDRSEYFALIAQPLENWTKEYRSRVRHCG